MNCKTTQTWMVEYADDALDAGRRAQVQAHLAGCAECARLSREIAATRGLLRALPPRQTSAQFEARLAERLAQARRARALRTPGRSGWRPACGCRRAPCARRWPCARRRRRSSGVALYPTPTPVPPPAPAPAVSESALVSQCVAQHQSAAAAQPLSDPAAQNLTASLGDRQPPPPRTPPWWKTTLMTTARRFVAGRGWRWRRCCFPAGRRWRGRAGTTAASPFPRGASSPPASRRPTRTPRRCCGRCWWRKTTWPWRGLR